MSSLSNYAEQALLDHLFNLASFTQPTLYMGVSTADPGEDGSGIAEPSGNNYSRVATSSADWSRTGSTVENIAEIAFPEATGNWGTLTHAVLMDADTGGNVIAYAALTSGGVSITANDTLRFPVGDVTMTLD